MPQGRRKQAKPIKRLPDLEPELLSISEHQFDPQPDQHWISSPTCSNSLSSTSLTTSIADDLSKFREGQVIDREKPVDLPYQRVPPKRQRESLYDGGGLQRDADNCQKSASGEMKQNTKLLLRRLNNNGELSRTGCNFSTAFLLKGVTKCNNDDDDDDNGDNGGGDYRESPIQRLERCVQSKKSKFMLGEASKKKESQSITTSTSCRSAKEAIIHKTCAPLLSSGELSDFSIYRR